MENSYDIKISELIKNFSPDIKDVHSLRIIGIYDYDASFKDDLLSLIRKNKLNIAKEKYKNKEKKAFEDLTVLAFKDQNNKDWTVIIYDSDDLWQDPVVMEVF
jgi:hypothetical protein